MYCGKCGTEVENNIVFCPNCGNQLNTALQQNNIQSPLKGKKMLNSKVLIISVVVAVIMIVSGISAALIYNSNDSIVGSWADADGNIRFSFYEDGTCDGGMGPYYEAAENGTITFYDTYHYPYSSVTYYEVDGNKLNLSSQKDFDTKDENTAVFYRD